MDTQYLKSLYEAITLLILVNFFGLVIIGYWVYRIRNKSYTYVGVIVIKNEDGTESISAGYFNKTWKDSSTMLIELSRQGWLQVGYFQKANIEIYRFQKER